MKRFNLNTNIFRNNHGINGGALYISSNENIKNRINESSNKIRDINNDINFENNIFSENKAENFGGAIYSTFNKLYLTNSVNNSIIENNAGIMGGGVYTPNLKDQNMFDITKFLIENNKVNTHINDYSTKPYSISLNSSIENNKYEIISGDSISLKFSLLDEYENLIEDITKYYTSLTLKLILKNINKDDDDDDESYLFKDYRMMGNIGTFIYGNSI